MIRHYSYIGPGMLVCATRGFGRSEAGHCFAPTFFLLSFFSAFYFSLTSEKLPLTENLFPPIFWQN